MVTTRSWNSWCPALAHPGGTGPYPLEKDPPPKVATLPVTLFTSVDPMVGVYVQVSVSPPPVRIRVHVPDPSAVASERPPTSVPRIEWTDRSAVVSWFRSALV